MTTNNYGIDAQTGSRMGRSIYQQYSRLPTTMDRVIQTSAWVVAGMPAGLAFREGKAGTDFEDGSPFLLHVLKDEPTLDLNFEMT